MALTKVSTGVVDMSGNTGGLVIAKGTTAQQLICNPPTTNNLGSIRENIDSGVNKVEVCTSTGWQFLEEAGPSFIPLTVDYLVVAGGGGGASGYGGIDGGSGGAGGLITSWPGGSGGGSASELPFTFTLGTPYTVTVGEGGLGAAYVPPYMGILADSGDSSVFNNITALGGGGSRGWGNSAFATGVSSGSPTYASGGGGTYTGSSGGSVSAGSGTSTSRGYSGSNGQQVLYYGGGGGGAGGAAGSGTLKTSGPGMNVSITGATISYAGGGGNPLSSPNGGGGLAPTSSGVGGNGTPNTGGGGGGAYGNGPTGGTGGSGVVILRYTSAYAITFQTGVGFISSTATLSATSEKVTTITAGSGTITFA